MLKEIIFVTTNKGKINSANKYFSRKIKLVHENLSLDELQKDTVSEVAINKAIAAYKIVKKPLIIEDSGFIINKFNGFPGPYIKFVLKTIGISNLTRLVKNCRNKTCYMDNTLVYIESEKSYKVFKEIYKGKITNRVYESESYTAWSDLWKIFIPLYLNKPLILLSNEEKAYARNIQNSVSCFKQFSDWVNNYSCIN